MSTIHCSTNLVTPEASKSQGLLPDRSINQFKWWWLAVCLYNSYTNSLKGPANNLSSSRLEPFMTVTYNLNVWNSILKWLSEKKSHCRELLFNVIVYLISCSNMAQAQAICFVIGIARRHRQQVKRNEQSAYFGKSNTLSHSREWVPITSPVHEHFNVCGILAEEHFSNVVLTDKQFFSLIQFFSFLNIFPKGYIPITYGSSSGREAFYSFSFTSMTDNEELVARASAVSHKSIRGCLLAMFSDW